MHIKAQAGRDVRQSPPSRDGRKDYILQIIHLCTLRVTGKGVKAAYSGTLSHLFSPYRRAASEFAGDAGLGSHSRDCGPPNTPVIMSGLPAVTAGLARLLAVQFVPRSCLTAPLAAAAWRGKVSTMTLHSGLETRCSSQLW